MSEYTTNFIVQKNGFSCGAVAVINALKWSGAKVSYTKFYKKVVKKCKTDKNGTYTSNLVAALNCLGKKHKIKAIKTKYKPYIKFFKGLEEQRYSLILIHTVDGEWHFSFWFDYDSINNAFYSANLYDGKATNAVSMKDLKKLIRQPRNSSEKVGVIKVKKII